MKMNTTHFILILLFIAAYLHVNSGNEYLYNEGPLIRYLSFRKHINSLWRRYTRETEDSPSFFSPSFNSTIIGKEMITASGRTIYAFQGFRYGMAADINTRFKPPSPVGKFWEGDTFEANNLGSNCPQGIMIRPSMITGGEEDCLYLNIYTPYLPSKSKKKLPVLFFIHGGSFTSGDASFYLPTRLLDHEVMLVTIQYRLGVLGFFTLNNRDAPGNSAFYDMIEALRWTQRYIEDFGGDKNKVTLFGHSAGSVSVNYLMLIPSARGLFHGAISQSGSALDSWAVDENPREATEYLAKYLECPIDNDAVLFKCIVQKNASDIVKAGMKYTDSNKSNYMSWFRGVSPTIQTMEVPPNYEGELLVTKHPHDYFQEGNIARVPILTGSTKHEGSYILGILNRDYFQFNKLHKNVTYMREQFVLDVLKAYDLASALPSLADVLQMKYCSGFDLGNFSSAVPCLIDMLGAMFFKAASWEMSNFHSRFSGEKTFYYSFDFENKDDSLYYWLLGISTFDTGVTHGDDMMYIFHLPPAMDTREKKITSQRMTKLWTNFAIYGNPTPYEERENLIKLGIPKWTPYTFNDHRYLLMQNNFTVENDYTQRWTISVDELRADKKTEI